MQMHDKSVDRFLFGKNWLSFLSVVDESHIECAENTLRDKLDVDNLDGKTFIDVGSGSGLFSLAARKLGARVHSFDFDPQSVACTTELRQRYFLDDPNWQVEKGSILDQDYLAELGQFDIVYSWGVLHHTGAMLQALENVTPLVAQDGNLFISIYNDQGRATKVWTAIKKSYNQLPTGLRWIVLGPSLIRLWGPTTIRDFLKGKPFSTWNNYKTHGNARGMSAWHDVVDWVGGYPFEVAKPEEIFDFYHKRNFLLKRLRTAAGGHGCNEFVFVKTSEK